MSVWTSLKHSPGLNHFQHRVHRVTAIKYKGYDLRAVGSARRARAALDLMGIKASGPAALPRNKRSFHFLKNPFKWKKHQEYE